MEPLDHLVAQESRDLLTGAIRALPETERLCFGLVHVEQFSIEDTASCTALRPQRVRQALARARELLKARLAG
jgi:DNA-directed RNA polymerase specialized sigma24 family protein